MSYKSCFIIPVYNHHQFIEETLIKIMPYGDQVFLIDDGSIEEGQFLLEDLSKKNPAVSLIRHPYNQGKGAAVITGLEAAFKQGFTHALQIDADGQHDHSDIPNFIEYSKEYPENIVSGQPIYDSSVPKSRLYGRYISHFWVWVETLSFDIKDSMIGFRVYPLDPIISLLKDTTLCQRMDFDTEILVRLYWRGVPTHFIKTRVVYPLDGISHFNNLTDNWRITKLHTRLFFGMLKRLPRLIRRKF